MYVQRKTFDEILHVRRNRATRSSPKHTVFSFMSEFTYTPYVSVPGFPRLEPGMQVLAVLRSEGDWKTLVGWRDLDTNALAAPDEQGHLYRLLFLGAWLVFATYALGSGIATSPSQNLLLLLFFAFWTFFSVVEYRSWRRAKADNAFLNRLPLRSAA